MDMDERQYKKENVIRVLREVCQFGRSIVHPNGLRFEEALSRAVFQGLFANNYWPPYEGALTMQFSQVLLQAIRSDRDYKALGFGLTTVKSSL